MRRRLPLVLALLLPLACASMWARSWWQYDFIQYRGEVALSECGIIYVYPMAASDPFYHVSGEANDDDRMWPGAGMPLWISAYSADRAGTIRWWFITTLSFLPAWWVWRRRRREGTRGFEVGTTRQKE